MPGCRDVAVIGGGNWGSAVAKTIGTNKEKKGEEGEIRLWVYEEMVSGRELTKIINTEHENVKYLEGVTLPKNVVAYAEIEKAVKDVEIVALAVPHEFLDGILQKIKEFVTEKSILVVLTKGFFFKEDRMELISENIKKCMDVKVCTLLGANIASEVAAGQLCECTLGYEDKEAMEKVLAVFNTDTFKVSPVQDRGCVEVCGALKNVVAIGCGIVAGHGYGINTVAAVIRNGLLEIVKFCDRFVCKEEGKEEEKDRIPKVFFESCGVADLIVTCTSGRNYRYSKMAAEKNRPIEAVEKEEMKGQKLQGYSTIKEFNTFMQLNKIEKEYPLLHGIGLSATGDLSVEPILSVIQKK